MLSSTPLKLGCERFVSVYVDDVTVIVSDMSEIEAIGTTLREYDVVARAKINRENSVVLQFGI